MTTDKYLQLLGKLEERTRAGTAEWQSTADDEAFSLSFPKYSVTLGQQWGEGNEKDIVVSIRDSLGNLIDEIRDTELASASGVELHVFYRRIKHLYENARRRASGVDEALDSVLQELD